MSYYEYFMNESDAIRDRLNINFILKFMSDH